MAIRLLWSERARSDVVQLRAYISRDSPFYARQFIERLLKRIDNLADFPYLGRPCLRPSEMTFARSSSRATALSTGFTHDHLLIVTVLHGRRDLARQENKP